MIKKLLILTLAAGSLTLGACSKQEIANATHTHVTPENYAKIQVGMDRAQVEALLGPPASSETKDMVVFKKTTATYMEGKDSIGITYKNQEVQEKNSTLGAPSTQ